MPYGQSTLRAYSEAGDPFLGGLIKGIGKVAGAVLPGPVGAAVRTVTGALGGRRRQMPGVRHILPAAPGQRIGAMRGLGFGPPGGRAVPRGVPGAPSRRRMNYSNQKALRRALRRATGYARQQKAVRKAAQEFAREFGPKRRAAPRRDLPRGHVHVR